MYVMFVMHAMYGPGTRRPANDRTAPRSCALVWFSREDPGVWVRNPVAPMLSIGYLLGMIRCSIALAALILASNAAADDACEPQRIIAPPEINPSTFSLGMDSNGRQWVLGDPSAGTLCGGSPFACSAGAAVVYELDGGVLVPVQTIVPHDAQVPDSFGTRVAIDGDRMIIGSLYTRWPGRDDRPGAVFYYEHDGEQWVEVQRIEPPAEVTREFGNTLALDGDMMLVRRLGAEPVHVYQHGTQGWSLEQLVRSPDGLPVGARFGDSILLTEDWCFIAATQDGSLARNGGSVYAFRRNLDGTLDFAHKIETPYIGVKRFGYAMLLDRSTLIITAPLTDRDFQSQGVVFFYEFENEQWTLRGEMVADEPADWAEFGTSAALPGDTLLLRQSGGGGPGYHGRVYRYARDPDSRWRSTGTLVPQSGSSETPGRVEIYGHSMTIVGDKALITAPGEFVAPGKRIGAAYLFDLSCEICQADLDADGRLTIFDYLTFLNLFDDGDPQADFDGDGELTVFDFLAFQTAFDAGCA